MWHAEILVGWCIISCLNLSSVSGQKQLITLPFRVRVLLVIKVEITDFYLFIL